VGPKIGESASRLVRSIHHRLAGSRSAVACVCARLAEHKLSHNQRAHTIATANYSRIGRLEFYSDKNKF
jgi:hypothetical protein